MAERLVYVSTLTAEVTTDQLLAKNVKFRSEIGEDKVETEFEVNIQFKTYAELVETAVKRVVWNLQQKARKGEFKPSEEVRTVNAQGNYKKSVQEEVQSLSKEQLMMYIKAMQEMLETK